MKVKNSISLNPPEITIMAIVKAKGFYSGTCHGNEIVGKGNRDDLNGFYYMRFQDGVQPRIPPILRRTNGIRSFTYMME